MLAYVTVRGRNEWSAKCSWVFTNMYLDPWGWIPEYLQTCTWLPEYLQTCTWIPHHSKGETSAQFTNMYCPLVCQTKCSKMHSLGRNEWLAKCSWVWLHQLIPLNCQTWVAEYPLGRNEWSAKYTVSLHFFDQDIHCQTYNSIEINIQHAQLANCHHCQLSPMLNCSIGRISFDYILNCSS